MFNFIKNLFKTEDVYEELPITDMYWELKDIFPGSKREDNKGSYVVLNNLSRNTQPNPDCSKIYGKAQDSYAITRREYMIVLGELFSYYLRICKASADSGYNEFVVIHSWIQNNDPNYNEWVEKYNRKLDYV